MPPRALYVYDGKMTDVGIDAVVRRQLEALTGAGWEVDLLARRRSGISGVRDYPVPYTLANLISWLPRRYYYSAQKRCISLRAVRFLRPKAYDAVVSWPQRALHCFRRARELSVPCFLNCDTMHYKAFRRPGRIARWPEFRTEEMDEEYELATRILAPSEFSRKTFADAGMPNEKLVMIGRGVDTERYHPAESDDPDRPFRLLFFGRVSERKGVRQIVTAWKRAALPNAELWFVGEVGREVAEFMNGLEDRKIILFGFRHDPEIYLRQCDAQILLSRVEGLAKSLLEGAASGLATLATARTGFPIVENVNGFFVDRKNTEAVAEKIRLLYEDRPLCKRLGANARAQMIEEYSWSRFSGRFIDGVEAGCSEVLSAAG